LASPLKFFHLLFREVVWARILFFHLGQDARRVFLPLGRPSQHTIEDFLHLFFRHRINISYRSTAATEGRKFMGADESCDSANLGRGPVTTRLSEPDWRLVAFRRKLTDNLRAEFRFAGRETA